MATIFIAACGRGPVADAPPEKPVNPVVQAEPKRPLVILTWAEYLPLPLLEKFTAETGIEIRYETVENSRQFTQMISSQPGEYDLIIADDKTLLDLRKLSLIQPLDRTLLHNLPNIDPEFLGLDFDPENDYSIPYTWGLLAVAYRSDLVAAPPPSWDVLWDEAHQGKVTLLDEPDDLFHIALLSLDCQPATAGLDRFVDAADRLAHQLRDHGNSMMELYEGIESLTEGETSVLVTYNCDAVEIVAKDPRVKAFIPEEGSPMWLDSFILCRESARTTESHRFIDFMLDADNAAATANDRKTSSPNHAARPMIDPAILGNPLLYPAPETLAKCHYIRFEGEQRRLVDRGMRAFYQILRERKTASVTTPANNANPEAAGIPPAP